MGKRNYRFFYAFILSLSFLTAFIFACVVTHLTLRELGVTEGGGSGLSGRARGKLSQLKGPWSLSLEPCPLLSLPPQALREATSSPL